MKALSVFFQDNFGLGDFSRFTLTREDPGCSVAIVQNPFMLGPNAMHAISQDMPGGGPSGWNESWAMWNNPTGELFSELFVRSYHYLVDVVANPVRDEWGLLELYQAPAGAGYCLQTFVPSHVVIAPGEEYDRLLGGYFLGRGLFWTAPSYGAGGLVATVLDLNRWYCIEQYYLSAVEGHGIVWVDGVKVWEDFQDTSARQVIGIGVGGWTWPNPGGPVARIEQYIDCIKVADVRIGCDVEALLRQSPHAAI